MFIPWGTIGKIMKEAHDKEVAHNIKEDDRDTRDMFAAAALQGMLAWAGPVVSAKQRAATAYNFADAMMEERKNRDA
jgi:hypothetical protein